MQTELVLVGRNAEIGFRSVSGRLIHLFFMALPVQIDANVCSHVRMSLCPRVVLTVLRNTCIKLLKHAKSDPCVTFHLRRSWQKSSFFFYGFFFLGVNP